MYTVDCMFCSNSGIKNNIYDFNGILATNLLNIFRILDKKEIEQKDGF